MALQLFDFIRVMFSDPKTYSELKNSDKAKHYFMTQRFMAIKFPATSQQLNRVGINPSAVVDLWQIVCSRFNRVPGWIYTKTKKVSVEKTYVPDPEASRLWMSKNELGERDLKMAIQFYPEEMKKTLKSIEKQIKMYD